jgi:CheY-like chemotaxis protein
MDESGTNAVFPIGDAAQPTLGKRTLPAQLDGVYGRVHSCRHGIGARRIPRISKHRRRLTRSRPEAVSIVLSLDQRQRDVGLEIEDVVCALGLAAADQLAPHDDAAFLDVNMPNRGGLELIAQLAKANYTGKVVVMSGSDPHYIEMSSTIGSTRGLAIAGTLAKPFRKQQIIDLLASLAVPFGD